MPQSSALDSPHLEPFPAPCHAAEDGRTAVGNLIEGPFGALDGAHHRRFCVHHRLCRPASLSTAQQLLPLVNLHLQETKFTWCDELEACD